MTASLFSCTYIVIAEDLHPSPPWTESEAFPCRSGCTDCCRGIVSLSVYELMQIERFLVTRGDRDAFIPPVPKAGVSGCPFRTPGGCGVYPVRPAMCRLFGFQYLHPTLRQQPFCGRPHLRRPGDVEAEALHAYLAFCADQGFVLIGRPPGPETPTGPIEDNRHALARFPFLQRLTGILTGGPALDFEASPAGQRDKIKDSPERGILLS